MAPRPISSRLHGVLDYATGSTLIALPSLIGLGGTRAGRILRMAGATHAAYSTVTRYELGVRPLLPFRGHLALDAVAAAGLAASPWLFGTASEGRAHWLPHLAFGLFEAGAVALTDPTGAGAENAPLASDTPVSGATMSPPDPSQAVMPDGAEANAAIGARTIGGGAAQRSGGVGSGTGPGSDPPVGGLQQ